MAGIFLLIASLELIQDKELMVNLTPSPEDHFQSVLILTVSYCVP